MPMPSPYELGTRVGSSLGGGVGRGLTNREDNKIIDQMLNMTQSGQDIDPVTMEQMLSRISPAGLPKAQGVMQLRQQSRTGAGIGEILNDPNLASSFSKLPADMQKVVLTQAMKNKYPSQKETYSGSKLITDIVKKGYGSEPGKEALARGESIINKSSEYLDQGMPPLKAYAEAVTYANKQRSADEVINKVKGPAMIGGTGNMANAVKAVKQAKKDGIYSDDELSLKLMDKGYTTLGQLHELGLNPTPQFVMMMGEQPEVPQEKETKQKNEKIKFDPSNKKHIARRAEILKQTGNKEKANKLLSEEFTK